MARFRFNELLAIGKRRGENWKTAVDMVPASFTRHGLGLITEYVSAKGGRMFWEEIGFEFTMVEQSI